jgi:uncharacterized protein YfdQ (DUF2303 family)
MTTPTSTYPENKVIADLADEAKAREAIDLVEDRLVAIITARGQEIHQIDLEKYDSVPARKRGTVTLSDADSFVTYVERHKTADGTTIWADIENARMTAVFNDHTDGADAGWGDNRAVLQLKHTPDWKHWLSRHGAYLNQNDFAEHIEDGVDAISAPSPAEMLEVAQTFHAKTGVNFESSKRLSGEVEFTYAETTSAKAGEKGKLEVPQTFSLSLAPFDGGAQYPVDARFRFRLSGGNLTLGYRLIRADRVLRTAFDDLVKAVAGGADLPVMSGVPKSA